MVGGFRTDDTRRRRACEELDRRAIADANVPADQPDRKVDIPGGGSLILLAKARFLLRSDHTYRLGRCIELMSLSAALIESGDGEETYCKTRVENPEPAHIAVCSVAPQQIA